MLFKRQFTAKEKKCICERVHFHQLCQLGTDAYKQFFCFVVRAGNTYDFPEVFPLTSFLPSEENQDGYYFYLGSLTTPVCNEVVQWIVYKQPVYMSKEQVGQTKMGKILGPRDFDFKSYKRKRSESSKMVLHRY